MSLKEFIYSVVPLSEEVMQDVLQYFELVEYPKSYAILHQGQTCKYLYFIEKGLARSFYVNEKGKEITIWFFTGGNLMVSLESFFQQKPGVYQMELLENSVLYRISYADLHFLFDRYHQMERFGRLVELQLMTNMIEKLNALQFQTAKQRYRFLIDKYPDIAFRAPLGHIASYLGITQETLSRIRADF